ncbi:MAG: hypothetical protein ACKO40_12105 [Planctomycetaceae bacterium]
MNAATAPDVVLLGNLLVDDIVLRDGRTLMGEPGGAVLHAALAAALWGARVGICSVAGTDYPAEALAALAARGVDLAAVRRLDRTGGRAWLLYEPAVRRTVHHLDCPSHADVSPTLADVPPTWLAARVFHLAPMPLARQLDLPTAWHQRQATTGSCRWIRSNSCAMGHSPPGETCSPISTCSS